MNDIGDFLIDLVHSTYCFRLPDDRRKLIFLKYLVARPDNSSW